MLYQRRTHPNAPASVRPDSRCRDSDRYKNGAGGAGGGRPEAGPAVQVLAVAAVLTGQKTEEVVVAVAGLRQGRWCSRLPNKCYSPFGVVEKAVSIGLKL